MRADGTCPSCGRAVEPGRARSPDPTVAAPESARSRDAAVDADDDRPPIPWHLWLLLSALAVYLGYRAFQGIEWVFGV